VPSDPILAQLLAYGEGSHCSAVVARFAVIGLVVATLTACGTLESLIPRPQPTPAAFCAPLDDHLGSVQLDYSVAPQAEPAVSAAEAERVGRSMMGRDQGVLCSLKLAKYDNLADHRPLVWVVHLDGLAIPGLGGPFVFNGKQPPPHYINRALVLVSTEAPPTPLIGIATGR
jgi:hypothetical protein